MNIKRFFNGFLATFLFIFMFLGCFSLYAQKINSEDALKEKAEDLFLDQNYLSAAPMYSQLLSIYPKDPLYNFRYGVCILFTEKNKSQAAEFLEAANGKNRVGPEVFFFLGRAYQMNYRFDEAVSMFERFQKEASRRMRDKLNAPKYITQTQTAKQLYLVSGNSQLKDSLKVPLSSLYAAYDFSALEGRILATPDKYRTPIDIKKNANTYLYYSKKNELILYASYGSNGKEGTDIYMVFKSSDGEWGKPVLLDRTVNTTENEAYPFITPDGKSLYFCSKGHNAIGGFDVFKSLKVGKTQWSEPENMGMPVNSPMDDIFFVTDNENENAFFASDRENNPGLYNIFKIKMKKKKTDFVTIKGHFLSDQINTDKISISVIDNETKEMEGTYAVNKSTGEYLISLKPGKTYNFIVESKGTSVQSKEVFIPKQSNAQVFQQKMSLFVKNGPPKLEIENDFQTPADAADSTAVAFASNTSRTENDDVTESAKENDSASENPSQEVLSYSILSDSTSNSASVGGADVAVQKHKNNPSGKESLGSNSAGKLSNKEIVSMAFEEAANMEIEAENYLKDAEIAENIASGKDSLARIKNNESLKEEDALQSITNEQQKEKTKERIQRLRKEAQERAEEAVVARIMAKQSRLDAKNKKQEAREAFENARSFEMAAAPLPKKNKASAKLPAVSLNDKLNIAITDKKQESDILLRKGRKLQFQSDSLQKESQKWKNIALQNSGEKKSKGLEKSLQLQAQSNAKKQDADSSFQLARSIGDSMLIQQKQAQMALNIRKELEGKENVSALQNKEKGSNISKNQVAANENNRQSVLETPSVNTSSNVSGNDVSGQENSMVQGSDSTSVNSADDIILSLQNQSVQLKSSAAKKRNQAMASLNNKEKQKLYAQADSFETLAQAKLWQIESYQKNPMTATDTLNAKEKNDKIKKDILASNQSKMYKKLLKEAREIESMAYEYKASAEISKFKKEKKSLFAKADSLNTLAKLKRNEALQYAPEEKLVADNSQVQQKNTLPSELKEPKGSVSMAFVNSEKKSLQQNALDSIPVLHTQIYKESDAANPILVNYKKLLQDSLEFSQEKDRITIAIVKLNADIQENEEKIKNKELNTKLIATELKIGKNYVARLHREEKILDEKQKVNNKNVIALRAKLKQEGIPNNLALAIPFDTSKSSNTLIAAAASPVETNEHTDGKMPDVSKLKQEGIPNNPALSIPLDTSKSSNNLIAAAASSPVETNEHADGKLPDETTQNSKDSTSTKEMLTGNPLAFIEPKEHPIQNSTPSMQVEKISNSKPEIQKVDSSSMDFISPKTPQENPSSVTANTTQIPTANKDSVLNSVHEEPVLPSISNKSNVKAVDSSAHDVNEPQMAENIHSTDSSHLERNTVQVSDTLLFASNEIADNSPAIESPEKLTEQISSIVDAVDEKKLSKSKTEFKKYIAIKKDLISLKDKLIKKSEVMTKLDTDIQNIKISEENHERLAAQKDVSFEVQERELKLAVKDQKARTDKQKDFQKVAVQVEKMAKMVNAKSDQMVAVVKTVQPEFQNPNVLAGKLDTISADTESPKDDSSANLSQQDSLPANSMQARIGEGKMSPAERIHQYEKLNKELEDGRKIAANLFAKSVNVEGEAKKYADAAKENKRKSLSAKGASEKDKWYTKQVENERKASEKSQLSVQYEQQARQIVNDAKAKEMRLLSLKNGISQDTLVPEQKLPIEMAKQEVADGVEKPIAIASVKSVKSPVKIEDIAKAATVFVRAEKSVYTETHPIPIDTIVTTGLIFKVQMGAFRKPIRQDLFKGIQPIVGEKLSSGIIRYSAGIFRAFESANLAKKEIRSLGFQDAFVVAYLNGKRIPIYEAYAIVNNQKNQEKIAYEQAKNNELQTLAAVDVRPEKFKNQTDENRTETISSNSSNISNLPSLASLVPPQSLYYTVQVGVFRKPEPPQYMMKIQPVYKDATGNGLFRYTSGIFSTRVSADSAKNKIIPVVQDAFVIVFKDGKKINLDEAASKENANSNIITIRPVIEKDIQNTTATPRANEPIKDNLPVVSSNEKPIFRVQIGAYRNEVPTDVLLAFLKIKDAGIQHITGSDRITQFFLGGDLKSYEEAKLMKKAALDSGIADVFIAAFYLGNKISVSKALELINP